MTQHTDSSQMSWRTSLHPDKHDKFLRIELVGASELSKLEVREHIVGKLGNVRDYLDRQAIDGMRRNCSVDHFAMQDDPYAVILRGDLRDLEHLKEHFDHPPLPKVTPAPLRSAHDTRTHRERGAPTPHITARSGHLRLVASNGIVLD